jgi:hypothetical protein
VPFFISARKASSEPAEVGWTSVRLRPRSLLPAEAKHHALFECDSSGIEELFWREAHLQLVRRKRASSGPRG